jgi:Domain found in Dishevelled, Egl-10, and Pleckstrin (DEP)
MAKATVALALSNEPQQRLWYEGLTSQGITATDLSARTTSLLQTFKADVRLADATLIVIDPITLRDEGLTLNFFAQWLKRDHPHLGIACVLPNRAYLAAQETRWAAAHGVTLLAAASRAHWEASLLPGLGHITMHVNQAQADQAKLAQYLQILGRPDTPNINIDNAYALAARLDRKQIPWREIGDALQGRSGLLLQDLKYRSKTYRDCVDASAMLDWVTAKHNLDRNMALYACMALDYFGKIHHCLREKPFADDNLFFRYAGIADVMSTINLDDVIATMRDRSQLAIEDRTYRGRTYAATFLGSDAVSMLKSRFRLSAGEAEAVGQSLIDLGLIHHVVDEHGFVDAEYFYRFYQDED